MWEIWVDEVELDKTFKEFQFCVSFLILRRFSSDGGDSCDKTILYHEFQMDSLQFAYKILML